MEKQLSLFNDGEEFIEPIFIEKFDSSEIENEKEEDIEGLNTIDLSDMAVTGTDWTTETIITQIKKNNIVLNPDFQRRDAWSLRTKSRFIESLFLGLPIPQIILAEQRGKKGKFIVIDGKQRLLSLKQFVLGEENLSTGKQEYLRLTGLEVKTLFNRMNIKDISDGQYSDEIDAFYNQPIRTVVVKNWPSVNALYLLFLRLNTGSVKLSPQELRQALYPGDFIRYANTTSASCIQLQKMLKLKKPDFRMRDVEIFIRYYAFKYFYSTYSGSMQKFLDQTCDLLNKEWWERKDTIENDAIELSLAIETTFDIFGIDYAFSKYKNKRYEEKSNRAVIDILLYYFSNPTIRNAALLHKEKIKQGFEYLCTTDEAFLSSIEFTTKSIEAVNKRFFKWHDILQEILQIKVDCPEMI